MRDTLAFYHLIGFFGLRILSRKLRTKSRNLGQKRQNFNWILDDMIPILRKPWFYFWKFFFILTLNDVKQSYAREECSGCGTSFFNCEIRIRFGSRYSWGVKPTYIFVIRGKWNLRKFMLLQLQIILRSGKNQTVFSIINLFYF